MPSSSAIALGSVHSNYKTTRCKQFELGDCSYGLTCTFWHEESEKRGLTDPLPTYLPEGATLPPTAQKLRRYKENKANGYTHPKKQLPENAW